jgi:hypothetical protein
MGFQLWEIKVGTFTPFDEFLGVVEEVQGEINDGG